MKRFCLTLCTIFILIVPGFGQESIDAFLYYSHNFEREKDYQSAIAEINKAIDIQPGNASLYLKKGRLYGNLKDKNAALENILIAISLKPDDVKFLEFCAAALNLSENFEESLKIAERLLSLREKLSTDRRILAGQKNTILTGYRIRYKTRFLMKDYSAVIEDVIESRDVVHAYNEGKEIKVDPVYYFIASETEGLLEKTLRELKSEPDIFKYYSELLRVLAEIKKSLIINPLRGLMMIEPVNVSLYADFAVLYEETHTKSETSALFERFAKDLGIDKRAEIYKKIGKYDLALKDLNELLKSNRDKSGRLSLIGKRGDLFVRMNQFDQAITDYETAKKIYEDLNYKDSEYLDKKIAEAKRRMAVNKSK